ncbi:Uncharacterized conserved protein UCP033563 [Spirochaeta thermophila DSM 6578]|uniref:Uncharacterized conserved protein UCP033563 n=2 Tax=Winmispira thermophila TaxID=154 RepID=G0GAQ9_WINT7|nr:Uncharacterized conserved protein UCP033563 [Spirochaeta thermophila DSM 6578]
MFNINLSDILPILLYHPGLSVKDISLSINFFVEHTHLAISERDHYCMCMNKSTSPDALQTLPLLPTTILLPDEGVDLHRWAVIACDQFTSQPEYWREVERIVGEAPSTLHLVLPEVHLDEPDLEARIARIHHTMRTYLDSRLLRPLPPGAVLTRRTTRYGRTRTGLLLAVDLEAYSYQDPASVSIIPTEATVPERIPPRLRIRRGAPLELPHTLLLVDDRHAPLIAPLAPHHTLYHTPLMLGGGTVAGVFIPEEDILPHLERTLPLLAAQGIIAAVGDGNHSLATAKALWEEHLRAGAPPTHPARYSLVEVVSIHDPGLAIEPIHRILFDTPLSALLDHLTPHATSHRPAPPDDIPTLLATHPSSAILYDGTSAHHLLLPPGTLPVETLQPLLDTFLSQHPGTRIDYTHGLAHTMDLAPRGTAILLPPIPREAIFEALSRRTVLPRKSFSLGEPEEKRYYLEARCIL